MFVKNLAVLFTLTLVTFCNSSFIEDLPKCHLEDFDCLKDVYQTMIRKMGKEGLKEFNIPPLDPMKLTNVNVNVHNLVNVTMVDGIVKGIRDCVFDAFSIDIKEGRGHQENTCDLVIKGHYTAEASSDLIAALLGGSSIHGDGHAKVTVGQVHVKFDFPFYAQKRDDGEIYIKCNYDLVKYDYDIGGPFVIKADNLYLGDKESSKIITDMMNQNWRIMMTGFGQPFMKKAIQEYYFKFTGNFFDNVPARYFIIEDLTPYARP
nr:Juvenile hormone-binding protein 6 [Mythimna separata]